MPSFEYSDALDPQLKQHIEGLYRAIDIRHDDGAWVSHFAENGVLKKGAIDVKGHKELSAINEKSWTGVSSRQHIVYKVFPLGAGKDEVMLYGQSLYEYTEGGRGDLSWAARLCFTRNENGDIKIALYHIYPSPKQ